MHATIRGLTRRVLICGGVALLGSACHPGPSGPPTPRLPGLPSLEKSKLLAYARNVVPYRTRLGAAARQILAADTPTAGPREVIVKLDPELNSFRLTQRELDAGAVVARFHKESRGAIRRFALGESDAESFWVVFRKGNGYMGRFVSASMDTTYTIHVEVHKDPEEGLKDNLPWAQAIAQFEYLGSTLGAEPRGRGDGVALFAVEAGGGTGWVSCMALGCCRTN
jgi:hypothetical protein